MHSKTAATATVTSMTLQRSMKSSPMPGKGFMTYRYAEVRTHSYTAYTYIYTYIWTLQSGVNEMIDHIHTNHIVLHIYCGLMDCLICVQSLHVDGGDFSGGGPRSLITGTYVYIIHLYIIIKYSQL